MQHKPNFIFDLSHFSATLENLIKEEVKASASKKEGNLDNSLSNRKESLGNTKKKPTEIHKMIKDFLTEFKEYIISYNNSFGEYVEDAFNRNHILARTMSFATPVENIQDVTHSATGTLAGIKFLEESIRLGSDERERHTMLSSSFSMIGQDCTFLFSTADKYGRPRFIIATPSLKPALNKKLYQIMHHPDLSENIGSFLKSQLVTFSDVSYGDIATIAIDVVYPDGREKKEVLSGTRVVEKMYEENGIKKIKVEDILPSTQERHDPNLQFFHNFAKEINPKRQFSARRHPHNEVVTSAGQAIAGNTCIVINHPDSNFTLPSLLESYKDFRNDLERGFLINKKFPIIEVIPEGRTGSMKVISIEELDQLHEIYQKNKENFPPYAYNYAIPSSWFLENLVLDKRAINGLEAMNKLQQSLNTVQIQKDDSFYVNPNHWQPVRRTPEEVKYGFDIRSKQEKEFEKIFDETTAFNSRFPIYKADKSPTLQLYNSTYNLSGEDTKRDEKLKVETEKARSERQAEFQKIINSGNASKQNETDSTFLTEKRVAEWGNEREPSQIFKPNENEYSPRNEAYKKMHQTTNSERPSKKYMPSLEKIPENSETEKSGRGK